MATKQKISPEDATILKTYGTSPATKRFARDLMLEGKTLEEVIKTCQNIAKKEQEIKQFISIHIPNFLEDIQYD